MRHASRRFLSSLFAAGLLAGLMISPAAAARPAGIFVSPYYVGPGGGSGDCASPAYATINGAIGAATEGDTIKVCPGVYREDVYVATNGLTIEAVYRWSATLKPPYPIVSSIAPAGLDALIRIDGASGVTIRGLRLAAPTGGDCDQVEAMVYVTGGATDALIRNNRIVATGTDTLGLCGYLSGVRIDFASSAKVSQNLIKDFQATGILVLDTGSDAFIRRNWIRYHHADETSTANGGAGIQVGAALFGPVGPTAQIRRNAIVGLYTASFSTPRLGTAIGITQTGPGTVVADNLTRRAAMGLLLFLDTTGARALRNRLLDGEIGIYTDGSGNVFEDNEALGNGGYDCYDSAFPTNTWTGNTGVISSPSGICSAPPD